jgi:BMFP domain-containing protein YqiC
MIDPKMLDDLAQRLARTVPAGVLSLKTDLEENFRSILQSGLVRLDLVSRQEFDVQVAVLKRTRELLEKLEARVSALEHKKG